MPRYAVAGLTLVTEMVLPELTVAEGSGPTWGFELTRQLQEGLFDLVHEAVTDEGRVWMETLRDASRYVLRFPGLAEFVVNPSRRLISGRAEDGVGPTTIRHLLLDQVVPHVLALDGSLVLHASVIAMDRGAIAFVGPSGFGKSSIAASFAGAGFALLADDFALLTESDTGIVVLPSYGGLRLWPDSVAVFDGEGSSLAPVSDESEKQRLVTGAGPGLCQPVPLIALIVLGHPEADQEVDFSVRRLSARDGLMAVFGQAFRMERMGRDRQQAEFDRFAWLARSTLLLRLDYRREYDLLPAIRAAIVDALDLLPREREEN